MLLNYAIIINLKKRRSFIKYIIIATIIVIIIFSIIWTDTNKSLGSSLVFLSVIYLCFNLAIYRDIDKGPSYIRILGKASLFMFAGVIVTVIVALSEGELLDLFGGSYTGEKDKKKMK
ncbi:MAG: hypothetical protein GX306_10280 [Clostridiales bacterium]|nr:hypothetical protein [Clostridiales bacterium]